MPDYAEATAMSHRMCCLQGRFAHRCLQDGEIVLYLSDDIFNHIYNRQSSELLFQKSSSSLTTQYLLQ